MRYMLVSTILLGTSLTQAATMNCNVESDYGLQREGSAYIFNADSAKPAKVSIHDGKLWIDGLEAKLSVADQQRIVKIERELSAAMPKIKTLAIDAADVAFTAVVEVGRGFGITDESISRLDNLRQKISSELKAMPSSSVDTKRLEAMVKPAIEQVMIELTPTMIGDVVSNAISAALGGDEQANGSMQRFEARMEQMGKLIEQKVEARVKSLEPQVKSVCDQFKRIDEVENSLDYRLPNGKSLDMLNVKESTSKASQKT